MDTEPTTVREIIDQRAQAHPGAVFLISPETGRVLTFRGLQEQSVLLGIQLREAGLVRGDKVAFLLDNGLCTAQLFLGTMYGGFVSVPLNVRAGVSTLSYTLGHCDAKVVFVGDQYAALIKEVMDNMHQAVKVIPVDVDGFATAEETSALISPLAIPAPEDISLLMYTSGSTGQPKAAVHSHRSVLAHGRNSICSHQLSSADRSLLVLPLYHINAECVTLVPALLSGGSVVLPHGFSVSQFWNWLDDYQCTWSAIVPTIISQLLDWKDPRADSRETAFRRIRFLRSSSAPLSPSLHREFLDKFKLLLIQAMGSTEAGNIFSNPLPPGENKIGSPGLPWGFETRILNQEGVEVPAGEPGEVFIRGAALMQGYYKDPEGTAAVLSPEGWFRTGDLAYRDQDGYFFVVGRSKELIIKGGVNIAPKQIDEVLESHPAVLEAAAVGVPDRYVGEDLITFVVMRTGNVADEKELLAFCEGRLGPFKTPTRIHFVKNLPKGPSGKVQRLKLQEKAMQPSVFEPLSSQGNAAAPDAGAAMPSTPIEQTIAATWAELLAQPSVDLHSNFFSLGGHSLLAIQSLSRLREKLPISLSLSDFFENATVAQQAALIRKRLRPSELSSMESTVAWEQEVLQKLGASAADEPIPRWDRSLPCPLSPNQQRIWFMEQLNSGVPVYNESEAVRLLGELNIDMVEKVLNVIIERHEILRSTIQAADGKPRAVVHESWPLRLKQIDLSSLAAERREAEVERLLIDEPRLPYHLDTEPGIRATLLRLGTAEHVFILMMHHIICDWSSEGVLWRELSALYRAGCRGLALELPALPIQHGDYAAWEQQRMTRTELAEDLAYWEGNLRGAPSLLELPTDWLRPNSISYAGRRQRFRLPTTLVQALRNCSRREKLSLFTLFTAVLDTLLYRYTGQEDILLGIPLAARVRPEVQSMIGFLLHTHVLRTQLSGNLSFRELLDRVKKGVLDLYAHRAAPFEQVVGKVQPQRNLSYSPLFQVGINWRDRDQQLAFIGMEGLVVESVLAETRTSKFDLTFMLTDNGDEIDLEIEYSTDLFEKARIERMVGHYQTLLEAVAADPDRRLAELPLLTDAERHQLLVEWNQTQQDYPRNKCIHELFEEQVERTPESTAVVFDEQRLTYRELNDRASYLARQLQKLGVAPDTLVAICVERSLEMVIGLLGILKAGGAFVPLDPEYPRERLAFMLKDAEPRVLVTQRKLQSVLPAYSEPVVCLDNASQVFPEGNRGENTPPQPSNLAYVIYTSGSTGKPKGVLLEHEGLCNLVHAQMEQFEIRSDSRVLQFASLSFDASVSEIFTALLAGAALIVARREALLPGADLTGLLRDQAISVVTLPPSVLAVLPEDEFPKLRTIVSAGEACTAEIVNRWRRGRRFINAYGPTESTVCASLSVCRDDKARPSIGRPIANTQLYILDSRLQPVAVGVSGELYIGGVGVARGYLNQPELTERRFIPDPFTRCPGARLYRTGDRARYLPDGNIEYLGRLDHQVKIRGFRIELGEIESVLAGLSGVREAVVLAREDVPGDKRLVAYLTAKEGELPKASELRGLLTAKLPEYMVPSAFVTLEKLPMTPNGKVDRKALLPPGSERPELEKDFVAPRTSVEKVLAHVWSQVLRIKEIGVHDKFFNLGGDSILSLQVVAKASRAGLRLTPTQIFRHQTVAELALVAEVATQPRIEQGVVIGDVPLTPIQRWFFEQDYADQHHWNQAKLVEMRQDFDPVLLESAIRQLVVHHDALRLHFVREEQGWRQFNAGSSDTVKLTLVDLAGMPEGEQTAAVESAAAGVQASLNLSQGPVIRATLFKLGSRQPARLLLVIHHLAVDGVSWRILLEDLEMCCRQLQRGEAVKLPSKTTSFRLWAQQLTEHARSAAFEQEVDYWLAVHSVESRPLPVDFTGSENTKASARTVSVALDVEETRALLQQVPQAYNTQINDVLLCALGIALTGWIGWPTVRIDLEGHGREGLLDWVDLSRTVGWFTTIFPVMLDLRGKIELGEVLRSVKEQLHRIPQHGIGYGMLRYLRDDKSLTARLRALPQAELLFNYLGQVDRMPPTSRFAVVPGHIGPLVSPRARRSHLLEVNSLVTDDRLRLDWRYSEAVHRRSTIEQVAQNYLQTLRSLIRHCTSPGAGGYTPSDFAEAGLNEEQLDRLLSKLGEPRI